MINANALIAQAIQAGHLSDNPASKDYAGNYFVATHESAGTPNEVVIFRHTMSADAILWVRCTEYVDLDRFIITSPDGLEYLCGSEQVGYYWGFDELEAIQFLSEFHAGLFLSPQRITMKAAHAVKEFSYTRIKPFLIN